MQDKLIQAIGKLNRRIDESIDIIDMGMAEKSEAESLKARLIQAATEKNEIELQTVINIVGDM